MRITHNITVFVVVSLSAPALLAQAPVPSRAERPAPKNDKFPLTVDSIMRGTDLVGYPPDSLRWSADSQRLYFDWRKPGEEEASTYAVGRDGGTPTKLTDQQKKNIPPANGRWDKARKRVLFTDKGDIVMLDANGTRRQITRTTAGESNPRWARSDTAITYVREGNLFITPLDNNENSAGAGTAVVQQLTDIGPKKVEPRLTDSQKVMRDEEEKLLDAVREQKDKKKKAEEKDKQDKLPGLELQDRQTAVDLMLSPDDMHLFVLVLERPAGARSVIVPNYVNETGYTEDIPGRTAVGDAQNRTLLAILNLKTGKTAWADASFAPPVDEPMVVESGSGRPPQAVESGSSRASQGPGKKAERELRWSMADVSDDGKFAVAGARSSDNKDRWYVTLDADTGKTRVVDTLHDDAWIQEAGAGFGSSGMEFLPDNHHVWFPSERDGWMHLYTLDVADGSARAKQLTSGKWEVTGASLARDGSKFYITTTEVHPGERHVYTVPIEGGARTKITTAAGSNEAKVSPDDGALGIVYSYSTKPPEVYVMANKPGAAPVQVTTTPTAEWRSFNWIDPKVITFKARDGVDVYARLLTPEMIGAKRDPARPGVVFVHGAGYLQNAHKYWSTYFREYMFNNLLASRGYVVLDVDYRASSGYGRDWRTAIYRHMGGKDLDDIVDGARYIAAKEQVNPKRIGLYGGSYGGFITLMAMFTTPDVFAAGAALRPVTDWAHYNHGYTSNILNMPQKDAEAYRKSSPIYFAEGLKGALLICHGMVDTNVLFQDSVRLAERLIELRKENWELASYPVENHGFERATSWADEYKRILKLFEENLRAQPKTGRAGSED
jgi:dipeptidyl aminopeptidase/acylaminoacyl peptidase